MLRKRALGFTIFPIGSDVSRVTVACLARLDTMLYNDDYFAIGTVATITAVMACASDSLTWDRSRGRSLNSGRCEWSSNHACVDIRRALEIMRERENERETDVRMDISVFIPTNLHTYVHACMHTHTYIHVYIHTFTYAHNGDQLVLASCLARSSIGIGSNTSALFAEFSVRTKTRAQ